MCKTPITAHAGQSRLINNPGHGGDLLAEAFELLAEHYINELDLEQLFLAALSGMTDLLDDYTYFMPQNEAVVFIDSLSSTRLLFGIALATDSFGNVVVQEVLEDSAAIESGIAIGDIIVSLNDEDLRQATLIEIGDLLSQIPAELQVKAEFLRDGEVFSVNLARSEVPNPSVFIYRLEDVLEHAEPDSRLRLINLTFVGENTAFELREAIELLSEEGVERIILDLRGNGGGMFDIALEICRMMVSRGPVFMMRGRTDVLTSYHSSLAEPPFKDIVVLVDGATASAGEVIAAALQDRGATVMGETSFGKSSMQHVFDLDVGYLRVSTHEIFGPSGMRIDKHGVVPDIEISLPKLLVHIPDEPDILGLKKALMFLGLFEGTIDINYDEAARYAVAAFREAEGLEPGYYIDIELTAAINTHILRLLQTGDIVLEAAYEHITNID